MKIIDEYRPGRPVPKMSRWSYTAVSMANMLEKVIESSEFTTTLAPHSLLVDGRSFFTEMQSILYSIERRGALLPLSLGFKNYEIARYCLARLHPDIDEEGVGKLLCRMSTFMQEIKPPQKLDPSQIEVAQKLHDLFKKIHELGGEQAYGEMMRRSHEGMDDD